MWKQTLKIRFVQNLVRKKAADKIINDAYSSTIKTVDFQIVSQPQIEPENQFTENNEFKFSATVDINPKLEMKDYKNLSIKLPENLQINVHDQYEKMITSYQKAFGKTQIALIRRCSSRVDFLLGHPVCSFWGTFPILLWLVMSIRIRQRAF